MDWTLALQLNHDVLLRNVAWLFTWLKLDVGGSVETLPRHKRLTVLFVLRPSEAAYRRVVLVAMYVRGVTAPLLAERAARSERKQRKLDGKQRGPSAIGSFKLIDPRKKFDLYPNSLKYAGGPGPRVTDMWSDNPIYDRSDLYAYQNRSLSADDDDVSAKALCHRMNALMNALQDLDGQAVRMARLHARMKGQKPEIGKFPIRPLRPGLPPGFRKRPKHEVDEVLAECHQLALMAQRELKPPDA